MSGDMNGYIEAGMIVIQLTFIASAWAVIAVTFACLKGFITDTIPTMPWHLSGILTMREYGYDDRQSQAARSQVVDPISWFSLFQTVLIAIGITLGSMLVWPVYVLLAVLYTIRAAYRGRESIMKALRAMMNYRPKPPSMPEFVTKGKDVWEAVQKTQEVCTCGGAPHDDDCAVLSGIDMVPPVTVVGENSVKEPRWARPPESERKQQSLCGPAYTAPYKDGKMIHDKEGD